MLTRAVKQHDPEKKLGPLALRHGVFAFPCSGARSLALLNRLSVSRFLCVDEPSCCSYSLTRHVMRSEAKKEDGGTKKGQAVKGAPAVQCPVHHLTDNECVCVRTFEARGTKLEKEKSTAPSSLDMPTSRGHSTDSVCVGTRHRATI